MSLSVSKFDESTLRHQLINTDPKITITKLKKETTTCKVTKYYTSIGSLLILTATLITTHVFLKKYFFHVLTVSSLTLYYVIDAVHTRMNSKISVYKSALKYYKKILVPYNLFLSLKETGNLAEHFKNDIIFKKFMKKDENLANFGENIEKFPSTLLPLLAQYNFLISKVQDLIVSYKYSKTTIYTKVDDPTAIQRLHKELMENCEKQLLFYTVFISFLVYMIRHPQYAHLIEFDQLIKLNDISSEMRTIFKYHDLSLLGFFATFKFTKDRVYHSSVTETLPRPIIEKELKAIREVLKRDFTQLLENENSAKSANVDSEATSTTISPIVGKAPLTPQSEKVTLHDEWIARNVEQNNLDSTEIPKAYFYYIQELQDLFEKNVEELMQRDILSLLIDRMPKKTSEDESEIPDQPQSRETDSNIAAAKTKYSSFIVATETDEVVAEPTSSLATSTETLSLHTDVSDQPESSEANLD